MELHFNNYNPFNKKFNGLLKLWVSLKMELFLLLRAVKEHFTLEYKIYNGIFDTDALLMLHRNLAQLLVRFVRRFSLNSSAKWLTIIFLIKCEYTDTIIQEL